jgi:hypothetical protein
VIEGIDELPIRVQPADGEAFHGYVRRVCERLYCTPARLLRPLAPAHHRARALSRFGVTALPRTYEALSQLLNLEPYEVVEMFAEGSPLFVDPPTSEQRFALDPLQGSSIYGQPLQLPDLALCRTSRACPACASIPGYPWKLEWQFRTVFACCEHQCAISFAGEPERLLAASMISAQRRILQVASGEVYAAEGRTRTEYLRMARCVVESAPLGHPNGPTRVAWITTGLALIEGKPMPPPAPALYRSWQAVLGSRAQRPERVRTTHTADPATKHIVGTLIDHFARRP